MTETTTVYSELNTYVEIASTNSGGATNILCGIAIAAFKSVH